VDLVRHYRGRVRSDHGAPDPPAQTSFYLGETTAQDGTRAERRSPYLRFALAIA
jgi:hypothetical protein